MEHGLLPEPWEHRRPKSIPVRFPEYDRDLEIARSLGLTSAAFYALPESEQNLWIDKWERDRGKCACGSDRDKCSDPEHAWYPQRTICFATMETAAANRLYDQLHEDKPFHNGDFSSFVEKPSRDYPYHYRDGVTVWVAPVDLSPGDKFLTDAYAPATPKGGEHGDQAREGDR